MEEMKAVLVRLPKNVSETVERISKEKCLSKSAVVRMCLIEYLKEKLSEQNDQT